MSKLFEYIDTLNTPYEAFTVIPSYRDFPVRPHWHYYMEIIIMLRGRVDVECDGKNSLLEPGDVFVFCPKLVHSISSHLGEDFEYGVLKFDISRLHSPAGSTPTLRQLFEGAQNTSGLSMHFSGPELPGELMLAIFRKCESELASPEFGYDVTLHSCICLFLTELIRVLRRKGLNTDAAVTGSTGFVTVDTISEYIDLHSSEKLAATELADMCGMSYSYFAKSFRQIYGRSFKEYLEFIRVAKAEDLLLFTDFDLTYISQETGFSDCSHLIKVFKKWKGVTPKQYRIKRKSQA